MPAFYLCTCQTFHRTTRAGRARRWAATTAHELNLPAWTGAHYTDGSKALDFAQAWNAANPQEDPCQ